MTKTSHRALHFYQFHPIAKDIPVSSALANAVSALLAELDTLDREGRLPDNVRGVMQDVRALVGGSAFAPVFRTVYRSRSLMSTEGEAYLLAQCRTNNRTAGLTGVLIHHDGHFIQVLEGEESGVRSALEKIKRDPRHTDFVMLSTGPAPARLFGQWSMGSMTLNKESFDALIDACRGQDHKVSRLLVDFVSKGTWR